MSTTKKDFCPQKSNFRVTFPPPNKKEEKINNDEDDEINDATLSLRNEAANIQKNILELSKKLKNARLEYNQLEGKTIEIDTELKKFIKNRDKQKDIYTDLIKTKGNTKIVIESQKRLMDKYIFITEQINSRPATGRQRPATGKQRPITANGLSGNLPKVIL